MSWQPTVNFFSGREIAQQKSFFILHLFKWQIHRPTRAQLPTYLAALCRVSHPFCLTLARLLSWFLLRWLLQCVFCLRTTEFVAVVAFLCCRGFVIVDHFNSQFCLYALNCNVRRIGQVLNLCPAWRFNIWHLFVFCKQCRAR